MNNFDVKVGPFGLGTPFDQGFDNKLLSDIVAFRTYAKHLKHLGRRESLEETINRNMQMHLDRFPKLSGDIVKAYQKIHQLKVMPSMRSMQFAGEAILKNNARIFNCSYAPIQDSKVFSEALFLLLSGVGFGFSVQRRHISQLPKIKKPKESGVYIIHDSIEGWAEALNTLMEAYFYGKIRPEFDLSKIRSKGSYLVTTGAKAPGPDPLKIMLRAVEDRLVASVGRKLTPIEVYDIVCLISDCVLAGGIRRAALICGFDLDDEEMLRSKHGTWWEKHPYRARSNNSVILNRDTTTKEQFDYVFDMCQKSGSGEPGFTWTSNEDWFFNPCCLAGDTRLLTPGGYQDIETLVNCDFLAYNYKGETVKARAWETGVKDVIKIHISDGTSITCTPDHRFMTKSGEEVFARDLLGKVLYNTTVTSSTLTTVWKIEPAGTMKVYDFSLEDTTHWGVVNNGFVAHNCEIALRPFSFCNLSTINQTGIKDKKDYMNRVYSATLLGTLQATYTDFSYLRDIWQETTEADSLLGVSFTGIADASGLVTNDWLIDGARHVLEVNEKYARKLGINVAARTTCVKPEGSASTVVGSASGIHARHADYYIRRIRMNKGDALANYLSYIIPELVEDDIFSPTGIVVSIPQKSPHGSIIRTNETAKTLFKRTMDYNKNWVHTGHRFGDNKHNVSVTISVRDDEWDTLREDMWNNRMFYSGISLLPFSDHTYQQAPFEDCSKEKYEEMVKLVKDVDLTKVVEEDDFTNRTEQLSCVGGICTLE